MADRIRSFSFVKNPEIFCKIFPNSNCRDTKFVILQIYFEQKLQNQFEQILQQAN